MAAGQLLNQADAKDQSEVMASWWRALDWVAFGVKEFVKKTLRQNGNL
jgi:hypothetical protein